MERAPVTRDDVVAAERRMFDDFKPFLRRTPMMKVPARSLAGLVMSAGAAGSVSTESVAADLDGIELWLKLEHLQVSGSFKARGMLNRLLSSPLPATGVIIASGGNAGIACAQAANALGVRCEVFVPELCSPAKQQTLRSLGASVIVGGAFYSEALAACLERQAKTGALLVHAYDQPEVVAGAGTIALEIESQAGIPDSVLVSVGGGGLIAGLVAGFESRCDVVALEPELCPTLHAARARGQPVDVDVSGVAADSLGARRIGSIAWQLTGRWVKHSLLISDDAIRSAQSWMWHELKLAVEPAAALPVAAIRCGAWKPRSGERVCLIVCGANFDPASLARGPAA